MHSGGHATMVRRFFAGLTEQTFQGHLGYGPPEVLDYLTDLLCRFVRSDAMYAVRNVRGIPLVEVVEMLVEAQERQGEARHNLHRHVGDFTLFWTGVYPEALPQLGRRETKDYFVDYCQQGKQAYRLASEEIDSARPAEGELLARLSENFELCAYGLGEVRREWEKRDDHGAPLLIVE